jgi:CRP-like cAMP-binding protein
MKQKEECIMVSPELLRRFPFFANLNEAQLRALAMIADEVDYEAGTIVLKEREPADWFFLLVDGNVDLTFISEEEFHPQTRKVFPVGEINPREVFGISALIEPYQYNSTATASSPCHVVKFDARAMRTLLDLDHSLGCPIMRQIARAVMERLTSTRIQLAAARS